MAADDGTRSRDRRAAAFGPGRTLLLALSAIPLRAGVGAFIAILILAETSRHLGATFLIAPFGASCVLVFAVPQSPLAQPRNVIGGHLISATIGLLVFHTCGATPFAYALGVGLATIAMALTGTIHPPAGANPVVVILSAAPWSFLLVPVLSGTIAIVLVGAFFNRTLSRSA